MAAVAPLKFITSTPLTKHTATVIFVHGLGDSGNGWKPVTDMFGADQGLSHVKWVLPHAPTRKVTANMGLEMPAWFDIASFVFNSEEDEKGMRQTVTSLNQIIDCEINSGIPSSRIILGGFSQGGAMALLTGMTTEKKLAGIAVMSGWLPLRTKFKEMSSSHAPTIPVFWGHGTDDPLVKCEFGQRSAAFLTSQLGMPTTSLSKDADLKGVAFNCYEGVAHSTNEKELDDLKGWIKRVIPRDD